MHNWFRGGPLTTYDGWARVSLKTLKGVVDTEQRGQGWALWKALVVCAGAVRDGEELPADAALVLSEILAAGGA
jgi:hypothetical protein